MLYKCATGWALKACIFICSSFFLFSHYFSTWIPLSWSALFSPLCCASSSLVSTRSSLPCGSILWLRVLLDSQHHATSCSTAFRSSSPSIFYTLPSPAVPCGVFGKANGKRIFLRNIDGFSRHPSMIDNIYTAHSHSHTLLMLAMVSIIISLVHFLPFITISKRNLMTSSQTRVGQSSKLD